jgi:hypothetical protein
MKKTFKMIVAVVALSSLSHAATRKGANSGSIAGAPNFALLPVLFAPQNSLNVTLIADLPVASIQVAQNLSNIAQANLGNIAGQFRNVNQPQSFHVSIFQDASSRHGANWQNQLNTRWANHASLGQSLNTINALSHFEGNFYAAEVFITFNDNSTGQVVRQSEHFSMPHGIQQKVLANTHDAAQIGAIINQPNRMITGIHFVLRIGTNGYIFKTLQALGVFHNHTAMTHATVLSLSQSNNMRQISALEQQDIINVLTALNQQIQTDSLQGLDRIQFAGPLRLTATVPAQGGVNHQTLAQ